MYALVHSLSIALWGVMPGVWSVMNRPSKLLLVIEIPDFDMHLSPQDYERRYGREADHQARTRIGSNLG